MAMRLYKLGLQVSGELYAPVQQSAGLLVLLQGERQGWKMARGMASSG